MQQIRLWQINQGAPKKIATSKIDLEKHLEEWIENDPDLLQEGLTIVGRQLHVESGPLDLLALDTQGRWIIIEIKKGMIRRRTIIQAVDYAACIASMKQSELVARVKEYFAQLGRPLPELLRERELLGDEGVNADELSLCIVGTGKEPGLERMVGFLENFNMPIELVLFQVFETSNKQQILVRELADIETQSSKLVTPSNKQSLPVKEICKLADQSGIGKEFRAILDAAQNHGLYPRPWKRSIMYAPPTKRNRCLFTVRASSKDGNLLRAWVGPEVFAEFYDVSGKKATETLGKQGWRFIKRSEVKSFIANLDKLFAIIEQASE